MTYGGGRAVLSALLLAVFSCASLLLSGGVAAALDEGAPLEGSGIHYPGGFDPNTVGEVRGTVHDVHRPERGPVRFRLETGVERYTVLVSPAWYWEDVKAAAPEGAAVAVRGSKTLGRDMELYVIAQEFRIVQMQMGPMTHAELQAMISGEPMAMEKLKDMVDGDPG